ncbi:MAG: hypothetical protein PHV34_15285 [Verrucomicrobiae bacterium]|nr:hypothetical protein [Verrucomicrobiae bacterium]
MKIKNQKSKILPCLLLPFAGLFAGLLLAEGLARIFLPEPARHIALLRRRAPDLQMDSGTDLKNPGYNPFFQRRPESEWICDGKNPEPMNNEGFRDRNFVIAKKDGVKRIACIGDSFTEGWMAPRDDAFPLALEKIMGAGFEVMNFGLANRSPLRFVGLYEKIVCRYHPDIVIVCLYCNDLQEDEDLRPYVRFDAYGLPTSFDYRSYFRHMPRMPQTLWEKRLDRLQWNFCKYSRLFPYAAVYLTVDPAFRKRTLHPPPASSLETLLKNTSEWLLMLRDQVQQGNALFILTYAPDQGDFAQPHQLLDGARRLTAGNQIPFIDPAISFLKTPDPASLYIPNDGHFSPEGSRRFAEEIATQLNAILQPPPPKPPEAPPGAGAPKTEPAQNSSNVNLPVR